MSVRAAPRPRPPVAGQLSVPLLLRHLAAPRLPILSRPPSDLLRRLSLRRGTSSSRPSASGAPSSSPTSAPGQHEGGAGAGFCGSPTGGHARPVQGPRTAPDAAAADINAFINAETRGKIPKLIEPSFVKDAKMFLTNAVYFKGFWKYPFKPQRTHKDKFFVTPEESVQVDMMTQTGRFKYVDSEKLHAQVLEMPYRGDAVSMVVLLPRSGRAKEVDRLVRRLSPGDSCLWLKAMPSVPLIVKFPRSAWRVLSGMNSFRLYRKWEYVTFLSTADLTNFTPVRGLLVNGAIHKALIEVDEEGAEAAAATAFVLNRSRSMPPKTTFTCNRPFVFFIQDNEANNILFMGFIGDMILGAWDLSDDLGN
ncbi:Alpha-1-antichymotrypsin [Penaeus vannamei]|uniref:Alpha-1-antichymotrypsin n=1 Tax=Penaeus vannamei TaxID=6689 RepID=A0A423U7L6_PENVA|nr:Alpha-1-antichymotrypsin [Penaeus vannamei]